MGNKPIADRISSASKVKQVSTFNLENLIDDSVLETIYEQFKSGSGVYVNDDEAYKEDFTEFNEQEKQSNTDLIKDRVIQEINEAITTGFSTPGFFMEELKEPSKFIFQNIQKSLKISLSKSHFYRIRKM